MKLAIGILAHNEEGFIGATIASLLSQSVFADSAMKKQVVVVANGCSDRTVGEAREALKSAPAAGVAFEVLDVEIAGKANAWNVFIHETSAPDTDYFVLLDADIEFSAPDAVEKLIGHLEQNASVMIAPDQPVKKFTRSGPMSALIRALQKSGGDDDHALSGQLYAARRGALRAIRMPLGIVVEDGFLRAMTLTANFSIPEDKSRILRAPGVRHFYRPYETLASIWRYERRQAAGTTINRFLYDEFRLWRSRGVDIVAEIAKRNEAEPAWLEQLIADRAGDGGFILAPKTYVLRRLKRLRRLSIKGAFKAPLIAAALVYDVAVAIDASRQLRNRGRRGAHWDAIRTS